MVNWPYVAAVLNVLLLQFTRWLHTPSISNYAGLIAVREAGETLDSYTTVPLPSFPVAAGFRRFSLSLSLPLSLRGPGIHTYNIRRPNIHLIPQLGTLFFS